MSKILVKRGTNLAVSQYIGESGELIFDTTNKRLSVCDGSSKGGIQVANVSDLPNNKSYVVIETYTNGSNWYRVYNDGWIEQGGDMSTSSLVTLNKSMTTTNYFVIVTWNGGKSDNFYALDGWTRNRTTTSFSTSMTTNAGNVR